MIWNPWARSRALVADNLALEAQVRRLKNEAIALDHALHQSNERYDRIREANAQLREALSLYRNA